MADAGHNELEIFGDGRRERGICSRLRLERLQAGELGEEETALVRAHISSCNYCNSVLQELGSDAQQFAKEESFAQFEAAVRSKLAGSKNPNASRAILARIGLHDKSIRFAKPIGLALAACFGFLLVFNTIKPILLPQKNNYDEMGVRPGKPFTIDSSMHNSTKGSSEIELYVGGAGQAARLAREGEQLAAGERIRVGYQAGDEKFVLIISLDSAGVATPLYPESGQSFAAERGAGIRLMPDSLELTGPGQERLIALFSQEPIEIRDALAAASKEFKRAGSLNSFGELDLDARQSTITVSKPK